MYEYTSLIPAILLFCTGLAISLYHRHLDPFHRYRAIGTFWIICGLLLIIIRVSFGEVLYYVLLLGSIISAFTIGLIKKNNNASLIDYCRTYPDHEHCVELQGTNRYDFDNVNENGMGV